MNGTKSKSHPPLPSVASKRRPCQSPTVGGEVCHQERQNIEGVHCTSGYTTAIQNSNKTAPTGEKSFSCGIGSWQTRVRSQAHRVIEGVLRLEANTSPLRTGRAANVEPRFNSMQLGEQDVEQRRQDSHQERFAPEPGIKTVGCCETPAEATLPLWPISVTNTGLHDEFCSGPLRGHHQTSTTFK